MVLCFNRPRYILPGILPSFLLAPRLAKISELPALLADFLVVSFQLIIYIRRQYLMTMFSKICYYFQKSLSWIGHWFSHKFYKSCKSRSQQYWFLLLFILFLLFFVASVSRESDEKVGKKSSYFHAVIRLERRTTLVCYTAVFSVVWGGALRDDTKNGCVAD